MELYVRTYPTDKQIPELLFRQGKLYYDYQVFDPAVRQWGLLLEKFPDSQFAVGAGELILDSFNKSKDYQNIETWARRLKKAPAFQTPEQQARLDGLIVGSMFKQGEQLAETGDHQKAAAAYLRAAQEFPKEARSAQAAVNAEVEARRAADLESLGAAAALLVKYHKERPEAAQGIWIAASTYQEVGLYSEAANYHAIIADNFPKIEHHKDAAFNAVLLRTTVGEHDKAIASGETFRRLYPKDDLADEVMFLMGKAHEKAGKNKEAEALYDKYSRNARTVDSQIEALVRLATVQKGDERAMAGALDRASKLASANKSRLGDRGKYYGAKARYMQGEAILRQYEAVAIEGDVKQLKTRLKKKSELLKKAAESFLGTAEMGVAEWTTASLYQIGFTYESFSKALLNSPAPSNLKPEEKDLYAQSIDEFVVPIEERALEAYESGWQKALELGIFNQWTAKMREALGRLNTELYPPLKEQGFELRSRGPAPPPPLIPGPRRATTGHSQPYLVPAPDAGDAKKDADRTRRRATCNAVIRFARFAAVPCRSRWARGVVARGKAAGGAESVQHRRPRPTPSQSPSSRRASTPPRTRTGAAARSSCSSKPWARTPSSGKAVTIWACCSPRRATWSPPRSSSTKPRSWRRTPRTSSSRSARCVEGSATTRAPPRCYATS